MKQISIKWLILIFVAGFSQNTAAGRHLLWYEKPATVWTEALPIGNSRLGAMVYGNPSMEQVQLNEETIWAGSPNSNANPDALENIPKVRDLIFAGKYVEAQELANEKVISNTSHGMPYQPFGDLKISFPEHTEYTDYYRELDLDSAFTTVTYKVGNVTYKREYIASFTDQVITIRLTADQVNSLSFSAFLTSPHQDVKINTGRDFISLSGTSSSFEQVSGKVKFQGRISANVSNGKSAYHNGVLTVENADEAIIYISIATNFVNYSDISADETARAAAYMAKAKINDYALSRKKHIDFYKKYLDRVNLDLGKNEYPHVPTDRRIQNFKKTNDTHLVSTYFQFGRYLLISSSQPGSQPANLQGIWNDRLFPPWDSKYTTNINLEMNYWPADVTNLQELNEPLFKLIKEISETGKETARIMYGTDKGWVLHHNTDIWRITGPVDAAPYGMWPTGGAWLCRHLWEHYLYTGCVDFLREAYPMMKDAALFFDKTMVYEPEHKWLVTNPSNSPENTHVGSGHRTTVAAGATMDKQLILTLARCYLFF